MRRVLLLTLLTTVSCTCKKDVGETAFEMATGGKIDNDGKTITIRGDDGEKMVMQVNDDGDTVTTITNGEDGTAVVGMGKLPDGFPLPVFEGSQIAMAMSGAKDGKRSFNVTATAAGKPEAVAAFYEKALKDKGLTIEKNTQAGGGSMMVLLSGTKGTGEKKTACSISVSGSGEGEDDSAVTISWNEPE